VAVGIEEVLLNVNGQDKTHFVLTEDGLEITEVGRFTTLEEAEDEAEYLHSILPLGKGDAKYLDL